MVLSALGYTPPSFGPPALLNCILSADFCVVANSLPYASVNQLHCHAPWTGVLNTRVTDFAIYGSHAHHMILLTLW